MHSGDEALLAAAVCDAIATSRESDVDNQKKLRMSGGCEVLEEGVHPMRGVGAGYVV